jgi:HEAT repeat protein
LRDKGKEAIPAITSLIAALKDKDTNVRQMTGNAIAAIGPEAAEAVPALIEAAKVKGEDLQTLRSFAIALGAIGKPAALPAVDVLKDLAKIPRVRWAAEGALRKLE